MLSLWKRMAILIGCLLLVGCWDVDYLKYGRLAYGMTLDLEDNGELIGSFAVRNATSNIIHNIPNNTLYYGVGDSTKSVVESASAKVNGRLKEYKLRIVLMGEKLARKRDIYPLLDAFYRNPKNSLNSRIAVVKGTANDIFSIQQIGNTLIGQYVDELIESQEKGTIVSPEDIQSICPIMLDPGEDFSLPYLQHNKQKIELVGAAMYHNQRMIGILNRRESRLLQLMRGRLMEMAHIYLKDPMQRQPSLKNRIAFEVTKTVPQMEIKVTHQHRIDVDYKLKLHIYVTEHPYNKLDSPAYIHQLNHRLGGMLSQEAKQLFTKMQQYHFDGLGIGRQMIAYHHANWKKMDFVEEYPKIHFHPRVEVKIKDRGLIY